MREDAHKISASEPARFAESPRDLRFYEVRSMSRLPDIRPGDFVLIASTDRYIGEGQYLDDWGNLSICQKVGATVMMTKTDPAKESETVTLAEFERRVVAKVAMVCKVDDARLIRNLNRG